MALMIRMIQADPQCSRSKLAGLTGLGRATVTNLVGQLIDWGVVREREIMDTRSTGRKPIRLELRTDNYLIGSIRIARNYMAVALIDPKGGLQAYTRVEIAGMEAETVMNRLCTMWAETQMSTSLRVLGIGVAVPGPYDGETGTIALMSGFPGWERINIRHVLEEASGLPVYVEHDANCGALAELRYGPHAPDASLLFVVADEGVGAGIINRGELFRGALGYSSEIGHASINFSGPLCECGNRGCIEIYASTVSMRREYLAECMRVDRPCDEHLTTDEFLELSRQGDHIARRIFEGAMSKLAFGMVSFVNALHPDAVIFANPPLKGGDTFLPIVKEVLNRYLMPQVAERLKVDVCHLSVDPELLGASVMAFEQLIARPSAIFCL